VKPGFEEDDFTFNVILPITTYPCFTKKKTQTTQFYKKLNKKIQKKKKKQKKNTKTQKIKKTKKKK